jgi:D-alanyl-D-alanine carboxypeptidase (penicillin-binding protein 5/6)
MAMEHATRRPLMLAALAGAAALEAPAALAQQQRPRPPGPARPGQPAAPREPQGTPASTPLGPFNTAARHALIIDFDTGATLLEKEADVSMPPASMSKLMTAYVVFEMLRAGRLRMDQELPVSRRAWQMGGSKMFVDINTTVRVDDLLRGVIIQSGNDACIVLAEAISGSEEGFAELLNERGRAIGLTRSNFRNSTGWPDPNHRMTCRDLATLATRIIRDFPEYYPIYSEKSFKYHIAHAQENRNPLVQRGTGDGLKTGHIEESGYGLTGSSLRGGRRVVLVVNGLNSMRQRAEESERLMDWSFREFENATLFAAGATVETAPVWLGAMPTVQLVPAAPLVVTVPRAWRRSAQVSVQYDTPIRAPIAKGQRVGALRMQGEGVPDMSVPLVAGHDVPEASFAGKVQQAFRARVFGG